MHQFNTFYIIHLKPTLLLNSDQLSGVLCLDKPLEITLSVLEEQLHFIIDT